MARRVGQVRRRDVIEKPICDALEAVGAQVTKISGKGAPDVLVRLRGRLWAFEVKSQSGQRTAAQRDTAWPIIRSVDEALQAIGVAAAEKSNVFATCKSEVVYAKKPNVSDRKVRKCQ